MKNSKLGGFSAYLGTLGALVILCIVLTIATPNFLTYSNLMSVLKQTTFTALLSTGMLLCLITAGIDLSVGANAIQPYDTDAIASCVIGGASFMGGKGTMFGTIIGALVIATLRNGFTLLSVDSAVQNMVLGLVIIGAVLLDVTREAMAAKARRKEAGAKA